MYETKWGQERLEEASSDYIYIQAISEREKEGRFDKTFWIAVQV
jgi:hypothetical protein